MKKICIFTGARSEYGLLKPLMEKIKNDKDFQLQIIVSGMHLSPEFGLTYKEIEKDGFKIDEKIEILLSADTPTSINKSIGLGIIEFSNALNRLKPNITIVLGDRFETLAFSISSYMLNIPIIHLHGGEKTLGSLDENIRHSITKLAYLHFASTEEYRKRIIQLGEHPNRVFNVGAIGLDNIKNLKLLSKIEVEEKIGKNFKKRNLLITFHPETTGKIDNISNFQNLLKALDELKDTLLIFTKSNADFDGRKINEIIENYTSKNKDKSICFENMGQLLYLSTMKYVNGVVGNSSSGIIEAPSFKIGTINIGNRQAGRIKANSIIDTNYSYSDIKNGLNKLFSKNFKTLLKNVKNPYGDGNTSSKIIKIIKSFDFKNIKKEFFDIHFNL